MRIPQLCSGALVVALSATAACSREDTREEAREVASEARQAAVRAGDRLADSWVSTKIQAQYFADDDIKARYIEVTTRDGIVSLEGYVEDERARDEAVQIARNTDGVRDVQDRLVVRAPAGDTAATATRDRDEQASTPPPAVPQPSGERAGGAVPTTGAMPAGSQPVVAVDDSSISTRIQAKYFLDPSLKTRQIEVRTADGVVTLGGEVGSEAERSQALLLARTTEGVERVEDSLTVNASLPQPVPPTLPAAATAPSATIPAR